jgi:hypothetical protein
VAYLAGTGDTPGRAIFQHTVTPAYWRAEQFELSEVIHAPGDVQRQPLTFKEGGYAPRHKMTGKLSADARARQRRMLALNHEGKKAPELLKIGEGLIRVGSSGGGRQQRCCSVCVVVQSLTTSEVCWYGC